MFEWETSRYHSHGVQSEVFGFAEMRIDGSDTPLIDDFTMKRVDGPAVSPKLSRNEPCWCGSGTKFKRCHGSPTTNDEALDHRVAARPP